MEEAQKAEVVQPPARPESPVAITRTQIVEAFTRAGFDASHNDATVKLVDELTNMLLSIRGAGFAEGVKRSDEKRAAQAKENQAVIAEITRATRRIRAQHIVTDVYKRALDDMANSLAQLTM